MSSAWERFYDELPRRPAPKPKETDEEIRIKNLEERLKELERLMKK